ncbi:hypothetical protein [Actinoplanes sp. NPDC049316]|uniref:hypothetical protein n=1 Tax=Actinoplanes sp. NPDC049316 TaxID=3154727 RepID=UPI0034406FEF
MENPFAHIHDEAEADGLDFRRELMADAKRGFAKIRKAFVQKADDATGSRASLLAAMVKGRQERAFDAFLLLHALEPVLTGTPLPLATWAKMLGSPKKPCSTQSASLAFDTLVKNKLAVRQNSGRKIIVAPLREDGSGATWDNPGSDRTTVGKGFLTIPYEYWTTGLVDNLTFPGKALFLIMLSETTQEQSFAMAVERAPAWYGISERTAERGYRELREQKTPDGAPLLLEHPQYKRDARSPTGYRTVVHRALSAPYSQAARAALQLTAKKAVRRHAAASTAVDPPAENKAEVGSA